MLQLTCKEKLLDVAVTLKRGSLRANCGPNVKTV